MIVLRTRRTLDEDIFLPLYPKKYVGYNKNPWKSQELLAYLHIYSCFLSSVMDNKNSGAYLFYQRQFWSCVKVCTKKGTKRKVIFFL